MNGWSVPSATLLSGRQVPGFHDRSEDREQRSHTNYGDIAIDLFGDHSPATVNNFVGLATGDRRRPLHHRERRWHHGAFFDGAIFHRIIDGFMVQGGDPSGTGRGACTSSTTRTTGAAV